LEHLSEVKLNTLVAGNCFGEYSLLDGHYVSATVETLEKVNIKSFIFNVVLKAMTIL
jgi:CRP-like cAMP-binding protein